MHGLRCIAASLRRTPIGAGYGLRPRAREFENFRDARLVADRWKWIILGAPRFGRILPCPAVDLEKLLRPGAARLPIAILDRPLRRPAGAMAERFKILLAQPEQPSAINLRVAADVTGKARPDLAAVFVEHHLG